MKTTMFSLALGAALLVPAIASAQGLGNSRSSNNDGFGTGSNSQSHYVQGHTRSNGDYVSGHQRTNPNNTTRDNFGTSPNYNPNASLYGRRNGS